MENYQRSLTAGTNKTAQLPHAEQTERRRTLTLRTTTRPPRERQ